MERPRFKIGQTVIYLEELPSIDIIKILKRKQDIDEDTIEYEDEYSDGTFYEYHLYTITEALKETKKYKEEVLEKMRLIKKELDSIDSSIKTLENVKRKSKECETQTEL
jgi:hypothetical protein